MLAELLRRPISIAIATLALVVVGLFSLLRLPVSLLPSLERPRLVVVARDAGLSRHELRQEVVEPLERRLLSLDGVVDVLARIDDGEALVTLETEWQTEVDRLRIDTERRLAEVAGLGLDELSVEVAPGDAGPVATVAVLGGRSAHERTLFVDQVLIPEVGRLAGAGALRRIGGALRRPVVRPRAADLLARGLTASEVARRLSEVGTSRPLGRLRVGAEIRPLVSRDPVESLDELANVRLGGGAGFPLSDVASVGLEEVPEPGLFRLGGEDGVLLEVYRAPGANAVLLARHIRRLLAELAPRSPQLRLSVARDASGEVVEALAQLGLAAVLGLALGALVLRWALGSWRPTLALMVVVPGSILIAFGGFYWGGISLDIVSLAGLALAGGLLVDNSIVVLEAIESARQAEGSPDREVLDREVLGRPNAEVRGTRQIALALVASFVTTAVVFVPLVYLRGLARAFFGVQAFAIVTTLAISLGLSLTLTPVLARRMERRSAHRGTEPGRVFYRTGYLNMLDRAFAHPGRFLGLVLTVLVAGGLVFVTLDRELVPAGASRVAMLEFDLPTALAPQELRRRVVAIEGHMRRALNALENTSEPRGGLAGPLELIVHPDRGTLASTPQVGLGSGSLGTVGSQVVATPRAELVVRFTDPGALARSLPTLAHVARTQAGTVAELDLQRGAVARALEQGTRGLDLEVAAGDRHRARRLAEHLREAIESRWPVWVREPGALLGGTPPPRPAWTLLGDPLRPGVLAAGGAVAEQVRSALGGRLGGRVEMARAAPEVLLEPTLPADLRLVPVRPGDGPVVPLGAVARVEGRDLPPVETRRNGRPSVRLGILPRGDEAGDDPTSEGRSAGRLSPGRLADWIGELELASDETVELVGRSREMERSFSQLRLALVLALVLVFLAVAALYESLVMPWVVMATVPLAAAGAFGALALVGQSFNIMSFLGLILLAGIVVNNSIVLLHRAEQRLGAGEPADQAVRQAAGERYRPIVMTTLTTVLGMLPLALVGGEGVELRRSLAVAVVGGSLTGLLASLWVVPVLYRVWARRGYGG